MLFKSINEIPTFLQLNKTSINNIKNNNTRKINLYLKLNNWRVQILAKERYFKRLLKDALQERIVTIVWWQKKKIVGLHCIHKRKSNKRVSNTQIKESRNDDAKKELN